MNKEFFLFPDYHIDSTDWFDNLIDDNGVQWKAKYEEMKRKYDELGAKYDELKGMIEVTGSVYAAKQMQLDQLLQKHQIKSDPEAKPSLEYENKRQKMEYDSEPNSWRCMALS